MRHIFSGLVAFFLAAIAMAAEVRLGSERALDPELEIGPAAFHQESPSVASNGREFLAVWIDRRTTFFDAPLFASRLGTDGRPFEPLGQRLVIGASDPHVASAGGDYLIAWRDEAGSNVLCVDENGRALGDPRRLHAARAPRELVSNGSTYLLLESARDGSPPLTATILDRDGAPLHTLGKTYGRFLWAGAFDDRYVVIAIDTRCDPGCRDRRKDALREGRTRVWHEARRRGRAPPRDAGVDVVRARRVGDLREGKVIRSPSRVAATPYTSFETVSLAWNGSEYVLAWTDPAGMIRAMRLTHAAMPIDDAPFDVAMQSRQPWSQFTLTPTASGVAFGYDRIDEASGFVSRAFTRTLDRLTSSPARRAVRH